MVDKTHEHLYKSKSLKFTNFSLIKDHSHFLFSYLDRRCFSWKDMLVESILEELIA